MHPFVSYILQRYYTVTGWNEDNHYSNLCRSSEAILSPPSPPGLTLHLSALPTPHFGSSYTLTALPLLKGSLGYVFSSREDLGIKNSEKVELEEMVERFGVGKVGGGKDERREVWMGGERCDGRDYLLYARLYIPSSRLDALYTTRLSPTVQLTVTGVSTPPRRPALPSLLSTNPYQPPPQHRQDGGGGAYEEINNLMAVLQHDNGRTCSEYSWSAEDGMFGIRTLHNFGELGGGGGASFANTASLAGGFGAGASSECDQPKVASLSATSPTPASAQRRIDEEDAIWGGTGLRGRFSAGGEGYFSLKQRSAGVSLALRFATLPPPLTHLAPSLPVTPPSPSHPLLPSSPPTTLTLTFSPLTGHLSTAYAAKISRDVAVASRFGFNVFSYGSGWEAGGEWWVRDDEGKVKGVIKAKTSSESDLSLSWEGRLHSCLVAIGVVADFKDSAKPLRGVGIDIGYFSAGSGAEQTRNE
uniref:Mitochondrial distribution and morphology protein 10 n=1 Tax=Bartheletia paradoxa TaxID=669517 RepID=A0A2D0XHR4_9BASI|nr:hypothetical protein SPAR05282 [Bartheletia paradoxa]